MLKRPAPKKLSIEAQHAITEASSQQTGRAVRQKTYDPNYPVFDIPINQKILAYIPNHTVTYPDGSIGMRMDKFAAHPVIDGRNYGDIRCANGVVVPELGLDGSCPLCDAISTNWELYNFEYDGIARSKGLTTDAPEAQELLKQDRLDLIRKMAVKQAEVWYTFPIVIIECEEKDGQLTVSPKLDAEGKMHGTPMWYSIRERTYQDKQVAAFDTIDLPDGSTPTSPAGQWTILNFTYQPKSGQATKMDSARALKVSFKNMPETYAQWAKFFDDMTAEWTPEKAQEVIVLDAVRDMNEIQEACDSIMKPVNDRIAMYKLSAGIGVSAVGGGAAPAAPAGVTANAEAVLQSFGVGEGSAPAPVDGGNLLSEVPNMGVQ